jgi:hypothetical protein
LQDLVVASEDLLHLDGIPFAQGGRTFYICE